ncbi:tetratricopeptide repeat protein [Paenibacillus hamazuiensis]|uniref:tetratricopeptide repeat protein n=1 Tax=Paenibacillus hamazuiensis TaxID=2936508 RepID=UPI00200D9EAA|nr:hypothetical protein [Paenibacillus hamazuiensis]
MKQAPRFVILTLAAALTAAGITSAEALKTSEPALEMAQNPGWPEELTRTVNDAKAAYEHDRSIPPELAGQLTAAKEQLIGTARQRLTLKNDGGQTNAVSERDSLPPDWRFWAEVALLWNDSRLVDVLLDWTRAFPADIYDRRAYFELVAGALGSDQKQLLLERLASANRQGTEVLLGLMHNKGWLDPDQVGLWLVSYSGKPQGDGVLDYLVNSREGADLIRIYEGFELTKAQRRAVIQAALSRNVDKMTLEWVKNIAATESDPVIEQNIDQYLVLFHGDQEAAGRLYRSGERDGFVLPLNGRVEKVLADLYPSGNLAEGVRLYESIRGQSYFYWQDEATWYSPDGIDHEHPQQSIDRWLDFLTRYPNHPSADDAAYRLARCYQLTGDGENALYWLNRAVGLGDRDLGYDARGMLLFVLDVEMPGDKLAGVHTDRLPSWMKPWIEYSSAVETLRSGKYREAANALRAFIDAYGGQDLFSQAYAPRLTDGQSEFLLPQDKYPFWEHVRSQLVLAERMAKLAEEVEGAASPADKADRQYALAAAIYREPLLFYNHLWRGERQNFFWFGHIKEMEYYEPLDGYIGRFNHLFQAVDKFAAIDLQQASGNTAAKTLYSTALTYSKLSHYSTEVSFHLPGSKLNENVMKYAGQLVERYPDSELADDALMLMYYHSGDKKWLEQVVERYPGGDQVDEAKRVLEELAAKGAVSNGAVSPRVYHGYGVRYEDLQIDDPRLPETIKSWLEEHRGKAYHGTMTEGDWVYALISADEGNVIPYLAIESENFRTMVMSEQKAWEEGSKLPRMRLARVKANFVHDGEWIWQAGR